MSITDELRSSGIRQPNGDWRRFTEQALFTIADRIDAAHQKAMDDWKARDGQMWLKGYSECRAEISEGNDAIVADLETNGWVRLPLDADGVPIHVGDVMDKGKVTCIRDCGGGWEVALDRLYTYDAPSLHHRALIVEDVLREFADRVRNSGHQWGLDAADTIAEFAAKLRMAEEDE